MSSTMKTLGLDRLSRDELYQLVQDIWDELSETEQTRSLTPTEEQLIDQRLAAADANPDAGAPWDEVKTRLMRRGQ